MTSAPQRDYPRRTRLLAPVLPLLLALGGLLVAGAIAWLSQ
jgi:hypothetical protein